MSILELPEDVILIRDTIRRFVDDVVEPRADEIERTNDIPKDILDAAKELGLYGMSIPEEYGGIGTSELLTSVAVESMSHGPGGATFFMGPNAPAAAIRFSGREDQKQRYLPDLAAGERFAAFCLSEAGAGSDAAGISTKAVRKNGKWVINGTKLWISRASKSSIFLVSTVTDPEKKGKGGISIFILDKRKGLEVGPTDRQLGGAGSGSAEVSFVDCEATDDEVLGEVGQGFAVLKYILGRARLWASARAVGTTSRALELSLEHAANREQFGQPIGEFQMVKEKLANMAADLYTGRLLLYRAAEMFDQDIDAAQEAAYAKLFCSEACGRAADNAVQIHGAMGLAKGFPVERLFRDVRAYRILDGTSDIQRLMIASRIQRHGIGPAIAPGGVA